MISSKKKILRNMVPRLNPTPPFTSESKVHRANGILRSSSTIVHQSFTIQDCFYSSSYVSVAPSRAVATTFSGPFGGRNSTEKAARS